MVKLQDFLFKRGQLRIGLNKQALSFEGYQCLLPLMAFQIQKSSFLSIWHLSQLLENYSCRRNRLLFDFPAFAFQNCQNPIETN